jgi:glycine cleavage system H lipoate-binding protein
VRNAEKATESREWLTLEGKWLADVGKTPKGKKPHGRKLQLALPKRGQALQRRRDSQTLKRSERLREENPRK